MIVLFSIAGILCYMGACSQGQEQETEVEKVHWNQRINVATGPAIRGRWQMNDSDFRYVDDPSAEVQNDGSAAIAWVNQSRQNILFQWYGKDGNARFDEPVNVSGTPDVFSWFPRVRITDGDPPNVYILWQEIVFSGGSHGGEAYFARSTDGGETFEDPVNLSGSEAGDGKGRLTKKRWDNGSLDLAVGPDGTVYAAWTEYEGRLWLRWSTDGGQSFSDPMLLAGGNDEKPARGPSIATGPEDSVYVAWTVGEDPQANVRVRSVQPEKREKGKVSVIARTDGHSDSPKIVVDGDGNLHAVFAESPEGRFKTYHVRYARRRAGADDFSSSRSISKPHNESYENVHYPALERDADGNLFVVWELYTDDDYYPEELGMTVSLDGGSSFSKPAVIPESRAPEGGFNGSQQGQLMGKLSVSPNGRLSVVNSHFLHREKSEVWLYVGSLNE